MKAKSGSSWFPPPMDVAARFSVSKRLREERQKSFSKLSKRCNMPYVNDKLKESWLTHPGLIFMAEDPGHQREDIGSMLLEMFCRHVVVDMLITMV